MKELLELLKQNKLTLSTAESFTGGLFGNELTNLSGASEVFLGGIIAYSNDAKINLLKVQPQTIENHTSVSPEVAKEMALNCWKLFASDIAISFTGNAGPNPSDNETVGLAFISICAQNYQKVWKINEPNKTRSEFKNLAIKIAINEIKKYINLVLLKFSYE